MDLALGILDLVLECPSAKFGALPRVPTRPSFTSAPSQSPRHLVGYLSRIYNWSQMANLVSSPCTTSILRGCLVFAFPAVPYFNDRHSRVACSASRTSTHQHGTFNTPIIQSIMANRLNSKTQLKSHLPNNTQLKRTCGSS
jgi:hypothetical protein